MATASDEIAADAVPVTLIVASPGQSRAVMPDSCHGPNSGPAESSLQRQSDSVEVQAQHQCHRMVWRFQESVVLVELFGSVVQGMHEQGSDPCVL